MAESPRPPATSATLTTCLPGPRTPLGVWGSLFPASQWQNFPCSPTPVCLFPVPLPSALPFRSPWLP